MMNRLFQSSANGNATRVLVAAATSSSGGETYSFASAGSTHVRGFRRNRGDDKREAKAMDVLVAGLTHMSKKQIDAVTHLLTPSIVENIGIAAALPRSNQGRKRQEDFIAKQVRLFVDEEALAKLKSAVELAKEDTCTFEDPEIAHKADLWFEALVTEGDDATFDLVLQTASESDVSLSGQELRDMVKLVKVTSQEEESTREESSGREILAGEGLDQELREILEGKKKTDLGSKRRAAQRSRNSLRKTLMKIASQTTTAADLEV